jgi:hypothetical protein
MTILHGPRRKHIISVVGKSCLQRHCIATEVTLLLLLYSLSRECVYQSLPSNEHLFVLQGVMSHNIECYVGMNMNSCP